MTFFFSDSWSEADQLAHRILTDCFRRIDDCPSEAAFFVWLMRSARDVCQQYYLQVVIGAAQGFLDDEPAVSAPHFMPMPRERLALLRSVLRKMSFENQFLLFLADVEGMVSPELAEIQGVALSSVVRKLEETRSIFSELGHLADT